MMAPTHPPTSPRRPKTNHIHLRRRRRLVGQLGSGGSAASGSGPQGGSGCGLSFGGAAGRSSASAAASQSASRFDGVTHRFVCALSLMNLSANQCRHTSRSYLSFCRFMYSKNSPQSSLNRMRCPAASMLGPVVDDTQKPDELRHLVVVPVLRRAARASNTTAVEPPSYFVGMQRRG